MEIIERVSIEDVKNAKPEMIWYAANTCWWTHDPKHLSTLPISEADIRRSAEMLRANSSTPNAPIGSFMERARRAHGRGLPCDPRGSVLFQTDDAAGFLKAAELHGSHYGRHGIRAFMAAHHQNCVLTLVDERPWSGASWDEYNDALDRLDTRELIVRM